MQSSVITRFGVRAIIMLALSVLLGGCSSSGSGGAGAFRPVTAGETFAIPGATVNVPPGEGWQVRQATAGQRTETIFNRQSPGTDVGSPNTDTIIVRSSRISPTIFEETGVSPSEAPRMLAQQVINIDAVPYAFPSSVTESRFAGQPASRYMIAASSNRLTKKGGPIVLMDLVGMFFPHPDDATIIYEVMWRQERPMGYGADEMTGLQKDAEQVFRLAKP